MTHRRARRTFRLIAAASLTLLLAACTSTTPTIPATEPTPSPSPSVNATQALAAEIDDLFHSYNNDWDQYRFCLRNQSACLWRQRNLRDDAQKVYDFLDDLLRRGDGAYPAEAKTLLAATWMYAGLVMQDLNRYGVTNEIDVDGYITPKGVSDCERLFQDGEWWHLSATRLS